MIVLDEQIQRKSYRTAIERWYRGKVVTVLQLRPTTVVKDDNIAALLHQANQPTFVTINVIHFWRKIRAHHGFCIIAIDVPQSEAHRIPQILRDILTLNEFQTKAGRMEKVIRWRDGRIRYYGLDNHVIIL